MSRSRPYGGRYFTGGGSSVGKKIADSYAEIMAVVHADTIEKLHRVGIIVRDQMKEEAPVRTGALKKSIRLKEYPNDLSVRVVIGNNKARHAHLVLFGTAPRRTKGSPAGWGGKKRVPHSTGSTRPNNFPKRALDAMLPEMKRIFGEKIRVDLE